MTESSTIQQWVSPALMSVTALCSMYECVCKLCEDAGWGWGVGDGGLVWLYTPPPSFICYLPGSVNIHHISKPTATTHYFHHQPTPTPPPHPRTTHAMLPALCVTNIYRAKGCGLKITIPSFFLSNDRAIFVVFAAKTIAIATIFP